MGIDLHALNFLRYVKKKNLFGKTVTIGRQQLYEIDHYLDDLKYKNNDFCEKLLINNFGSEIVDSIDYSNFESASIIHDMNKPLDSKFYGLYDTVLDLGSLEHIFNISQALKNCSLLSKQGGHIVHVSPANNMCGHGFFQFSPELFFSYYSDSNGYSDTEVYLADTTDTKKWFKVFNPNNGNRVSIESNTQLYIMVYTVLKNKNFLDKNVQQSDYKFYWNNNSYKKNDINVLLKIKLKIRELRLIYFCVKSLYNIYKILTKKNSNRLNKRNPNIISVDITSLDLL
jgi:hypothetical protein